MQNGKFCINVQKWIDFLKIIITYFKRILIMNQVYLQILQNPPNLKF